MDLERRIELVARGPTEEILVSEELKQLLETKNNITAYNGWEPSGMVHLGTGLMCAYKMKDFIEAGIKFKAYLAVWHGWINNKLGGDLELIRKAADHFKHSWLALGVPAKGIEFVYADELYDGTAFWNKMINVARNMTLARGRRTLEIMGRKESEGVKVSDFIYTPMQVADIFHMEVDICQLGIDQRKANVVARELGEKLGFWKPVCVHHHLLQGLSRPVIWPIQAGQEKEALTSAKMSKSKPGTCVFIYDEPEDIKKKINNAFCPEKIVEHNPIIDIGRHIIFREKDSLMIKRSQKFGGNLEIQNFPELEKVYRSGDLHPADLKLSVADVLIDVLAPVREYFKKNKEAAEGLEVVKNAVITR